MDDSPLPTEPEVKKEGSLGPMSATIIIILIVLIGGVYFLVQQERHIRAMKLQEEAAQLPTNS